MVEENLFWDQGNPESWDEAAEKCLFGIYSFPGEMLDSLMDMRVLLDRMIGRVHSGQVLDEREFADSWRTLGATARNAARKQKIIDYQIHDYETVIKELADVLVRKQNDYGHDNINRFGRLGLLVRVHDKIARLENLARRGTSPKNESVRDNYMDVINYCAIGMMVEMEWFLLELKSSVAEDKLYGGK